MHRRELINLKLRKLFSDQSDDSFDAMFSYWRMKAEPVNRFPEKARKYVAMLKDMEKESDQLQKDEVAAKINMKYARHDPEFAFRHAKVRGSRYPEGEAAIAKNSNTAFEYATSILRRRFPEGEAAIATDPELKHRYESIFKVEI
jgi:hypothetical protein